MAEREYTCLALLPGLRAPLLEYARLRGRATSRICPSSPHGLEGEALCGLFVDRGIVVASRESMADNIMAAEGGPAR